MSHVLARRTGWLNPAGLEPEELKKRTLTVLYNQRPAWLDQVHRELDEATFAAYQWPKSLSDDEILARLLQLNFNRPAVDQSPVSSPEIERATVGE